MVDGCEGNGGITVEELLLVVAAGVKEGRGWI